MTEPEAKTDTKAKPEPASLVIGSNLGHAQRHAEARGLPKTAAIAVDHELPKVDKNQTVLLARPTADRASNWTDIEAALKRTGCNIETDTTG